MIVDTRMYGKLDVVDGRTRSTFNITTIAHNKNAQTSPPLVAPSSSPPFVPNYPPDVPDYSPPVVPKSPPPVNPEYPPPVNPECTSPPPPLIPYLTCYKIHFSLHHLRVRMDHRIYVIHFQT